MIFCVVLLEHYTSSLQHEYSDCVFFETKIQKFNGILCHGRVKTQMTRNIILYNTQYKYLIKYCTPIDGVKIEFD